MAASSCILRNFQLIRSVGQHNRVLLYQRFSNCRGAVGPLRGREFVVLGTYLFWTKYGCKKKYIFSQAQYFTCHLVAVLAPNYKQHILSPAEVRKECYSLAEIYVIYVYLNLFEWKGARRLWNILKGVQAIKVWEHLYYIKSTLIVLLV
jgi:hypothetical protein